MSVGREDSKGDGELWRINAVAAKSLWGYPSGELMSLKVLSGELVCGFSLP